MSEPGTESAPATESTSPPPTPVWRVPDNDPRVWARGMTAEEVLNAGSQMYDGLSTLAQQPQYQPQYQQPAPQRQLPGDDDVVDGRTFNGLVQGLAPIAQQAQTTMEQVAAMTIQMARQTHGDVFGKYGHEMNTEIAKLPTAMRTVDNLNMIAQLVRGRHVEDLANDRAKQIAAGMNLSLRGDSSGAPTPTTDGLSLESDTLPPEFRDRLKNAGVTMPQVRDFCRKNNMTVADWFKSAGRSAFGEG